MKKFSIILVVFFLCLPVYSETDFNVATTYSDDTLNKMFVICSPNRKMCAVGKHRMTSNGSPLYVEDGILCTFNRKTCTNGFTYMRSSEPIEIVAKSVLCTKNKKVCTVGKHKISSNSKDPLYIEDGIVCTADKKMCTNGFSYMRSNVPLR